MKILSGMEKDFDGEVLYCGQNVKSLSDSEKGYFYNHIFGFVWQDFHLLGKPQNTVSTEFEGQMYDYTVDDSFFFSKTALDNLRNQAKIKNESVNFVLRAKTPADLISIKDELNTENMDEKYPMPKAVEKMSYGVMPRAGQDEIALSPSLVKKFTGQINNLIGKEMILAYGQEEYCLTVSGIFNAGYDDFFISSDIEQVLYEKADQTAPYALSYDVKRFEDVVSVTQMVKEQGIQPQTATDEVEALWY